MIVKSDCSGCMEPFTLKTADLTVTMQVPSNGKQGRLHVPAHTVTAEASEMYGGELIIWDCPRCQYADSYDPSA